MKPLSLLIRPIGVSLGIGLLLTACAVGAEEVTPTYAVEQIQTMAVATFSAGMTSTALAVPTNTLTEAVTPTTTATSAPAVTSTSGSTRVLTLPTASCYGFTFVSDVTVPDNTTMTPGQKFTKTWRVRNSGSCPWQAGFKFKFTGGEVMGGSAVSLASDVQPDSEVDISVALTAPTAAGTYRGNWRMADSGETYFGDEVYVLIVVGSSTATSTPKVSATPTLASTASATYTSPPASTETPSPTPTETDTP